MGGLFKALWEGLKEAMVWEEVPSSRRSHAVTCERAHWAWTWYHEEDKWAKSIGGE